ncbi:MAG: transketolase C-terminal domain-containing protein, partial [Syntrophales bacterium]
TMIAERETRCELYQTDDAELLIVAYGTASRIAKGAIKRLRKQGLKVGLFRPISLWPFPSQQLRDLAKKISNLMVFEMSAGQMLEDVLLALQGKANVGFHGRPGGVVPTPVDLAKVILRKYNRKEGLIDTEL